MNIDDSTQAVLARMSAAPTPRIDQLDATGARALFDPMTAACEHEPAPLHAVRDITIATDQGDLPARLYQPVAPGAGLPLLLFFHGGGGVLGNLDTHDSVCRSLALHGHCAVLAVDYRLGPEHRFPAGLHDAGAALEWAAAQAAVLQIDPNRIALGGDSAGAALVAALARQVSAAGRYRLCLQLLIYPAVDADRERAHYPSWRENGAGFFLDQSLCRWFQAHYHAAGQDLRDPSLSPLHAPDLTGLPPTLILTAGLDPLRDEAAEYAERLRHCGVPVTYRCYDGTIHGFVSMGRFIPLAVEALQYCGAALRQAFADPTPAPPVSPTGVTAP